MFFIKSIAYIGGPFTVYAPLHVQVRSHTHTHTSVCTHIQYTHALCLLIFYCQ